LGSTAIHWAPRSSSVNLDLPFSITVTASFPAVYSRVKVDLLFSHHPCSPPGTSMRHRATVDNAVGGEGGSGCLRKCGDGMKANPELQRTAVDLPAWLVDPTGPIQWMSGHRSKAKGDATGVPR
jgi:hypothetical protein